MSDSFFLNGTLNTTTHQFSGIWRLTRVMKAAGWNVVSHSNGTTKTAAGTNGNDSWGSNANPLVDTYPAFDSAAAWIVMSGPNTLKITFLTAPTGSFVRGESVTQVTSGATGEMLGVVWDSTLAVGWAIIAPRTGTFNNTNIISGAISLATFTPTSLKTFNREVVFFKNSANVTSGTIYYICADSVGESASLFSTLATSVGCTATIAPGAGGTGNTFPTIALTIRGTGGSVSHDVWQHDAASMTGAFNVACANNTTATNTSADGSFYFMTTRTVVTNAQGVSGFFRLDNTEPGDVDPYVWFWGSNSLFNAFNRTSSLGTPGNDYESWTNLTALNGGTAISFKGYAARDGYISARDVAVPFWFTYSGVSSSTFSPAFNKPTGGVITTQNHPSTAPPFVRENPGLVTDGQTSTIKMFKGTIRWFGLTSNGVLKDTFDGKKWICITPFTNATNPAVIVGPWDGSTTPT